MLFRPTFLERREGSEVGDLQPGHDRLPSAGEMETARREKRLSQNGRSSPEYPCHTNVSLGMWPGWESEGPIVPVKPWREGGGKR